MKILKRLCPKCGRVLKYKNLSWFLHCKKHNGICRNCSQTLVNARPDVKEKISRTHKGKKLTQEHKDKISIAHKGKKRLPFSEECRRKMSESHKGKKLSFDTRKKISSSKQNISKETLLKLRMARINQIIRDKFHGFQIAPSYNPIACQKIDEYGKQNNYNFQHAMNGGEFYIKELGYWVDGYDTEKNVVIEYYETWHSYPKHRKKDINRKKEIINKLKCKFIIIKEK